MNKGTIAKNNYGHSVGSWESFELWRLQNLRTKCSEVLESGRFTLLSLFGLVALALGACAQSVDPNAVLLFKSGFEDNVYLDPAYGGSYQFLRGTDAVTHYSWPIMVFNPYPQSAGIQNVISRNQSTHLGHAIETVTGPYGQPTKALRLRIKSPALDQTCCIQAALQAGRLGSDLRDVYVRYWLKLGPEFLQQTRAHTTDFWRMMWEMKTLKDYRITPMVYADPSGTPYWYIKADNNPDGCSNCQTFWEIKNHTVPVPTDRWFLMEFYIHRSTGSDGRVFWGVDGQVIADKSGRNYGVNNEPVFVLMYKNLYGNYFPQEEWIDDLEIWDRPPCTNLPCGAPGGTNPSDIQAPTVPDRHRPARERLNLDSAGVKQ